MSKPDNAVINAVGMVTPLGLSFITTAAAVRSGLSLVRKTAILDRHWLPVAMSLVPENSLVPLAAMRASGTALTVRQERMLRLGAMALSDLFKQLPRIGRVPWLIAGPDEHPRCPGSISTNFLQQLQEQTAVEFDVRHSGTFPHGRAGGILALTRALSLLRSDTASHVIVGGVDSHLDLGLLSTLDAEERIRSLGVQAGYIPGEGAAFLLLSLAKHTARWGNTYLASIEAAACTEETGHLYSDQPHRGDGLARAFGDVFSQASADFGPVRSVYAGMNGEYLFSKEWGVAYLRHQNRFAEHSTLDHPVDCLGDPGAALAPLLLGLSAKAIARQYRQSPSLVWCASDLSTRGVALLNAPE